MMIVEQVVNMSRSYDSTLQSIVAKERLNEIASLLMTAIKRIHLREREKILSNRKINN